MAEDTQSSSDIEDSEGSSIDEDTVSKCSKLGLPEHIAAYQEGRALIRDDNIIIIDCDSGLVADVMANYIIAKKILSNLCWQDRMLCKHVCTTWRSAVNALAKEQFHPVDFVYNMRLRLNSNDQLKKSDNFHNPPLAVFTFLNRAGLIKTASCKDIIPCPCKIPCNEESHTLLDVVNQRINAPKNCMLSIAASSVSYLPLPTSMTAANTICHFQKPNRSGAFIGGIYIPTIPNVEFHTINIQQKNRNTINFQKDFYDVVDKLSETRIFKGLLVFVTEYYILQSIEGVMVLDYFKELQPDIPYALGGCIVEDTVSKQSGINNLIQRINNCHDFSSDNLITIGLFSIPKNENPQEEKPNFDMFSLIIQKSEWTKVKIQEVINNFSKRIPHFEHSVAFKLTCIGRDKKHDIEQQYFRAAFPDTPLVGCYGNGELGLNHPPRPCPAEPLPKHLPKRTRRDPHKDITYSYSTVFVYIGWGKILVEPENPG